MIRRDKLSGLWLPERRIVHPRMIRQREQQQQASTQQVMLAQRIAAGGSPLLTDLVSYWKLDEASGNALDAHGTNDLTDTNSVGTGTGVINGARDFERSSTQYFISASNSSLQVGDIDFTWSAWVKLESKPATRQMIVDKGFFGDEYAFFWENDNDIFRFDCGGAQVFVPMNPSTGVWYFILVWHDATASEIKIQIDDGTVYSSAAGTPTTGTNDFFMGAWNFDSAPMDGLIDEVGFWKRLLTTQERTDLYNSGAGLAYPFS